MGLVLLFILCLISNVKAEIFSSHSKTVVSPDQAEIGYWFYKSYDFYPQNKINQCLYVSRWKTVCGFVDPDKIGLYGQKAYQFEQKQYHALLHDYALHPNDVSVISHWREFNSWVIKKSITAAYAMQFVDFQNPEINQSGSPFSQLGNLVIRHIEKKKKTNFFHWLSKSSLLVFFSRTNCPYCHAEAPIVQALSQHTGIPVWNASLDNDSIPGFDRNMHVDQTLMPAIRLKVKSVPTIFLYLNRNKNQQGIWLRIATGITSEKTMEDRLVNFVLDYRHALLDGVKYFMSHSSQVKRFPNQNYLLSEFLDNSRSHLRPDFSESSLYPNYSPILRRMH